MYSIENNSTDNQECPDIHIKMVFKGKNCICNFEVKDENINPSFLLRNQTKIVTTSSMTLETQRFV